ncbi:MAG TPA: hypothetical protein VMK42_13135 [Anaeromyxobacteraceae bacterium]|nr:hypothetical protein [Anaeromyxobacteraceae bacterium]
MKVLCESCGSLSEGRLVGAPDGVVLVCGSCGAATSVPVEPASASVAAPPPEGEEEAWSELRKRWEDDGAHRAFLSRFVDLEGLARAGARYREVLAASPSDPPAARARDELLARATALGLAELPRASARGELPRALQWGTLAVLAGALLGGTVWVVYALAGLGAMR